MVSDGSPYCFLSVGRLKTLERLYGTNLLRSGQIIKVLAFAPIQEAAAAELKDENWKIGCLHDLRKSFATLAAASGVPMRELQAHLGQTLVSVKRRQSPSFRSLVQPSWGH